MPPTPSSSGCYYPETNEFPPPPGQWQEHPTTENFHSEPVQQVQDQQRIPEPVTYNPADYVGLAPTRPQAEAYNPAEYAAGMAGQPSQEYFQPLPQQYEYQSQAQQPVSPQDYRPDYQLPIQQEPAAQREYAGFQHEYQPEQQVSPLEYRPEHQAETQQGPTTYLNYAGMNDNIQPIPESEYQPRPLPSQQSTGPLLERSFDDVYDADGIGGGGSDGSHDRAVMDDTDSKAKDKDVRVIDDVSTVHPSQICNPGA